MNIDLDIEFPGAQTQLPSMREARSTGEESHPALDRGLLLVSVIAILVVLLVVQADVGLTSVENARGLTPAGELAEATGQATTAQGLPITSAYHDNPISISGGGSMCLYR